MLNVKLSGNLGHAIHFFDETSFSLLKLKLVEPRESLKGTVGGAWGLMDVSFKYDSNLVPLLLCCGGKREA